MDFQSTFPARKPTSHKCIVYDTRDGRIVLVHEFLGDGTTGLFGQQGQAERERITLQSARKQIAAPEHLNALHLAPDFPWDMHTLYRVDVETGILKQHGIPSHK
ncbi:MAG TPA: hypothetical protein VE779_06955 [Candidatus Angelobacter sp.]|nr:hypothetical protein [Candidatus Angelobacter sp.]